MSDRPSAVNGKRNRAWGTLDACPACGQCLCFGCHPAGPCVDEQPAGDAAVSSDSVAFISSAPLPTTGGWHAGASRPFGASGVRMRTVPDPAADLLR